MVVNGLQWAVGLACGLFAVAFLQSGIDKATDWNGNLEWLKGHFAKTFLAPVVPLLLAVVLVLELIVGAVCALGVYEAFTGAGRLAPILGMVGSCVVLLMLFTGQRVAKDYAGAAVLASYFGVALLGLYLASLWTGP